MNNKYITFLQCDTIDFLFLQKLHTENILCGYAWAEVYDDYGKLVESIWQEGTTNYQNTKREEAKPLYW